MVGSLLCEETNTKSTCWVVVLLDMVMREGDWDGKEMEPAEMIHPLRPPASLGLFKKRKGLPTKATVMQMLQFNAVNSHCCSYQPNSN